MRDNNIRDVRQISLQGLFVWGTIAPNVDLMLMIYIYIYIIYIYIFIPAWVSHSILMPGAGQERAPAVWQGKGAGSRKKR